MYRVDMYYTIKTLLDKGYSQRKIARELGIHRKTVKKIQAELEKGHHAPRPIKKNGWMPIKTRFNSDSKKAGRQS